jgi:UDP-N-acetylglucosamine--N-acetylmuramyl-(pentapeptide) pyrophosphoryl-undecaprenol N-acetylglucosamine transferase
MSGYVTVPAAMAARRAKVPFVLQEQNAVPGIAARFASRRAGRTFLGLAGPSSHLPRSELIGNPIRSEFNDFDRESRRPAARQRYGVDLPGPVVGVMGGSQGARVLNQVVEPLLASGAVGAVVHLTGKDLYPEVHDRAKESSLPWVCVAYEAEMEHFYAAVDLVVSRSGAMTVTELAATSTPSVLVPLARVGQQGNAEVLRAAGGAEVIEQSVIEGLASRVADLVADRDRLDAMGRGASSVHRPGAARLIAHHLMEVAHG